jgi:alpha/beta superfamily hydrolase
VTVAVAIAAIATPASAAPGGGSPGLTTERKRVVETTFRSVDATLAGQWDFPERSPAPLVVIVPSSPRLDRNGWPPAVGEEFGKGLYARIADTLVSNGFAVFRFDGPGTGRSGRGRYATDRSNALEAYTRAVDHARVDPDNVFMLGHSTGSGTVASIYGRYESVVPPAGVIFLDNSVGEQMSLQIDAPLLIVNPGKDPDGRFQYGEFVAEARGNHEREPLETEVVILMDAERGALAPPDPEHPNTIRLHPKAVTALVRWLREQHAESAGRSAAR